eukprot:scaffold79864_cov67-Phaeocystis_antarctica.AAC.6
MSALTGTKEGGAGTLRVSKGARLLSGQTHRRPARRRPAARRTETGREARATRVPAANAKAREGGAGSHRHERRPGAYLRNARSSSTSHRAFARCAGGSAGRTSRARCVGPEGPSSDASGGTGAGGTSTSGRWR